MTTPDWYKVFAIIPFGAPDEDGNQQQKWTQIGIASTNRDGSITVKPDLLPARSGISIQLRPPDEETTPQPQRKAIRKRSKR